ncbi:hypothetical protein [Ureibacillus xyleni]|nr:hypothetical protein [Ureibacillus xyleni]
MNTNKQQPCKACGSTTFAKGIVKNGHAKIMPIDKFLSTGSFKS